MGAGFCSMRGDMSPAWLQAQLTKQERVRAVMHDTALDPTTRQKRIREIMREESPGGEASEMNKAGEGTARSRAEQERLKNVQKRVKALVAHGKAQMGRTNVLDVNATVPELAGDREVDVRVILGGVEEGQVGGMGRMGEEDDVLSLGVMPASSTIREVKATATFGVEQLSMTGVELFAPSRTRMVVAVSGQVLKDEDRCSWIRTPFTLN